MEMNLATLKEELSSPKTVKSWGDSYLCQVGGFWYMQQTIQPVQKILEHFKPNPSDVILASFPKTGTTWLKSLLYAIVYRSSKHHLAKTHPHDLVPFLEFQLYACNDTREDQSRGNQLSDHVSNNMITKHDPTRRIFATHLPYQLLAETLESFPCRVVYITRNPKDTVVSNWKFLNKWAKMEKAPVPLDVVVDKFCRGLMGYGPYYGHVSEYRSYSLDKPNSVFFITYEDLMEDPKTHVKKLAEFLGCPFEKEKEEEQADEIVKMCSFEELSNYEINKSQEHTNWLSTSYNSFFRKGTIGDHKTYLDDRAIERIDALTKEKFHSKGFMYGI